jgi:hypothetical protein
MERLVRKKMTRMNLLFIHLCVSDLLVILVEIPVSVLRVFYIQYTWHLT